MLTRENAGQVLSCEIKDVEVLMLLSETESNIRSGINGKPAPGPHAVGDPVHVEKSFVRNLGDLMIACKRDDSAKEKSVN